MSESCPKCHARSGRCDCRDTDPEMVAERIEGAEEAVALLAEAILEEEGMDRESWLRDVLRPAATEALARIGKDSQP